MNFQKARNFSTLLLFVNLLITISNVRAEDIASTSVEDTTGPEVTISQGTLRGITKFTRSNRTMYTFRGIPYAKPPIGNLRFSNPVPADDWTGTLDAGANGNTCLQISSTTYVGEEDCLYLNVHTPQLPDSDDTTLLPVMVYIHGGGFEIGSGDAIAYGPDYLLDSDLLLVTMNYRLGPFGFLSTGDEVASGNWGLKDQILALIWVQRNIAKFGGDPEQVTIFGESAGGASVQLLALSDSTTGLFNKYISQSGAAFGNWVHQPRSTFADVARRLGEMLDCNTTSSSVLVSCLRELNVSKIIMSRLQFSEWNDYPIVIWGPTDEPDIEGAVLTDSPTNLYAAGKVRDIPSISGVVRNEGISFLYSAPLSDQFGELLEDFDILLPIVLQYATQVGNFSSQIAAFKEFYFNNDLTTDNRTQLWYNCTDLIGDAFFNYPIYNTLRKKSGLAKNSSYLYSFEYRGSYSFDNLNANRDNTSSDVVHEDDLLYIFPLLQAEFGVQLDQLTDTDLQMLETVVQLWTSFAINGTPETSISNTTWLPFSSDGNYLRIGSGSDATLEVQYDFLPERMQFWNNVTGYTVKGPENAATISSSLSLSLIFVFLIAYSGTLLLTA